MFPDRDIGCDAVLAIVEQYNPAPKPPSAFGHEKGRAIGHGVSWAQEPTFRPCPSTRPRKSHSP